MGPKVYPRKSKDSHRALHTRVLVSFSASPMLVIHRRVVSRTSAAPWRQRTTKSSAYVTSTAPYRRSRPYLRNALNETMHVDGRHQWRNHAALRSSSGRLLSSTHPSMPSLVGLFNRRLQPHRYQMQHLPIADTT